MRLCLVLLGGLVAATPALADEGMWMPSQMPALAAQLKAAGYTGQPGTLADLAKPPLNAVVKVGGSTGAFVSADGLVLTNHHVAYGVIQYNSKPERNLLRDGFVAHARTEELPANPDYRVLVTTGFDRVSDRVLGAAKGKTGRAYFDAVDAASKALVADCEREPGTRCSIANMYYGSDFYLIRQLELRDIRLVYAPPEAIGRYGDEIDNFMWPRHSGDFTVLRAYVGKDGKPAAYSPDNVPYRAPAHLQIARDGVKAGDFVMLAGYPGTTYRHRMASEFAEQIGWRLPAQVDAFGRLINVIEAEGAKDPAAAVTYASQLASLKNSRKRYQGELEGLVRSDGIAARKQQEDAMFAWLDRAAQPASTRADIDAAQALLAQASATRERDLLIGQVSTQTQLLRLAIVVQRLAIERQKPDDARESGYQQRDEALIEGQLKQLQRRYSPVVEQRLLADIVQRYQQLPAAQHVPEFDAAFGRTPDELQQVLTRVYGSTQFGDEAVRLASLKADASSLAASDDAMLKLAAQLLPATLRLEDERKIRDGELLRLRPAYMAAQIAWYRSQGRSIYPDANSTLRLSYGKVAGFSPRDGVNYAPVTTVAGIVQKHTGKAPFDAPAPLLAAIARGDFGHTGDPVLKTQTVDFLSNLDTTGGNSGSPVLNARGQLVGLNFDSNWEAVSASWKFDPRYKRAVHVDMRYLRWLMEKVYPAPELLQEMNLSP